MSETIKVVSLKDTKKQEEEVADLKIKIANLDISLTQFIANNENGSTQKTGQILNIFAIVFCKHCGCILEKRTPEYNTTYRNNTSDNFLQVTGVIDFNSGSYYSGTCAGCGTFHDNNSNNKEKQGIKLITESFDIEERET